MATLELTACRINSSKFHKVFHLDLSKALQFQIMPCVMSPFKVHEETTCLLVAALLPKWILPRAASEAPAQPKNLPPQSRMHMMSMLPPLDAPSH
jgi:hypothetical protein